MRNIRSAVRPQQRCIAACIAVVEAEADRGGMRRIGGRRQASLHRGTPWPWPNSTGARGAERVASPRPGPQCRRPAELARMQLP
jgi:hypothetical protein